ncbi:fungal-specific transcription factor domain-containing protein [Xylariales sp. PMI_506]|nr:fungal-specific transcription factor domain-containing protein [Xylariales sp. PMI_506]
MSQTDGSPSTGGVDKPPAPLATRASHIPACDRCRTFKKRCSRTFPVCTLCASAGQKCSFSTPTSSANAQIHHLRARVEWLSRYINQALPAGSAVEDIDTGTNLSELLQWVPSPAGISQGQSPASTRSLPRGNILQDDQPMHDPPAGLEPPGIESQLTSPPLAHPSRIHSSTDPYEGSPATRVPGPLIPTDGSARRFVDAYFRNVNRAYPFVNRQKVLQDLETLGDLANGPREASWTLLYLIMAIGCTTLARAGQIPADTASRFKVAYSDIIQECLARENVESVQILVLLALYSLFDPAGASTWSIVGLVARQAMLLGLTRRSSDDKSLSAVEIELRHRLLWSIFVLDRMMAVSLGLPVALTDENMDVPLPGLTIEEFASPDRSQYASLLQTSRHVIMLRQMEGRILEQVHLPKQSRVSLLTHADRRAVVQDMRSDIENWYSNGCLVSPLEPDNVPIHNSITWLSARYYYLLILLYYPTHFNTSVAGGCAVSRAELLRFAQKHVQSTSVLFQQRQLPLNRVTLCRVYPVILVLLHGFAACAGEGAAFPARDEVATLITILDAFAEGWVHAHRAAQLLRQFLAVVSGGPGDVSNGGNSRSSDTTLDMVRQLITDLQSLMGEFLGKATCYRSVDVVDEREFGGLGMGLPSGAMGPSSSSVPGMQGVLSNDGTVMNYNWSGPLELDFL